MRFSIFVLLATVYVRASSGGALQVIDHNRQCVIWSNDNYGCTGYSVPFGQLEGDNCAKLSKVINGTRQDFSVLKVDACGTENGQPAAWIQVNQTGLITFFNQNGDKAACTLDNGLNVGSWCSTSHSRSTTSLNSSSAPVSPTMSSSGPSQSSTSLIVYTCTCSAV